MGNARFVLLSAAPGLHLAEDAVDVRGRRLLSDRGELLGVVADLRVDRIRTIVVAVLLADGRAFDADWLELHREGLVVRPTGALDNRRMPRLGLRRAPADS